MRARKCVVLMAAALLLAACGGGGSPAVPVVQPEAHASISMGLVRGDVPTVLPQPQEALTMLRHPILDPGLPETLLSPPGTYQLAQATAASMPPAATWCGTCSHAPVR